MGLLFKRSTTKSECKKRNGATEFLHNQKRKIIKTYQKYFSVDCPYTCIYSDKSFTKKYYKRVFNKPLNLKNPRTFNEKLNWIKLYDHNPQYTVMADKYAARSFFVEHFSSEYLVELLGVWENADSINFDLLPEQFVLKCNHDNGVLICRDKSKLNYDEVRKEFNARLKRDYYRKRREWPYKNIPRVIICEKFMENTNGKPLEDYKVFCFNGKPKIIEVNTGRYTNGSTEDYYDTDWKYTDIKWEHCCHAGDCFEKPAQFDEMMEISRKLSENIPFLRVDFNCWDGKIYIGEMTFFYSAGFRKFKTEQENERLGSWISLPTK